MPHFPKILMAVGITLSLVFLSFFVLFPAEIEHPPQRTLNSQESNVPTDLSMVSDSDVSELSPWVVPERAPAAVVTLPTTVMPTPVPKVDTSSLILIGSANTQNEGKKYFFKYQPTGQVLSLIVGQDRNGWKLISVEGNKFTISGPGGNYEVTH